jgi:hypothetical protein
MAAALAYREPFHPGDQWQNWPTWNHSSYTATASGVQKSIRSGAAITDTPMPPQAVVENVWDKPVVDRLNHLLLLQNGWDGPGSLAISGDIALKAFNTLAQIALAKTRAPSISPGRDGSLQFAWYARDLELEIEVLRAGSPTISLYDRNAETEIELTLTSPELAAAIRQLSAG